MQKKLRQRSGFILSLAVLALALFRCQAYGSFANDPSPSPTSPFDRLRTSPRPGQAAPQSSIARAPEVQVAPLPPLPRDMPPEAAPEFIEGQVPPLPGLPEHVAFRLKEPPKATQVALGKYLFFDNSLSGDQKLSCATCHQPALAWTDGLPLSKGYPATLYFRNTPTLLDAAAQPTLYWDGRFASDDLESLVRDHITEAHFMNADGQLVVERLKQKPQYEELFQATLGGEPSFGRMLKAVAAYVGSLTSPPGPYDRYLAGESNALSPEAQRGLALFEGQAGCARCHNGPLLSDGEFHNLGVPENPAIFQEPLRHITFRRFFRTLGVPNYRNLHQDVGLYALTGADEDWGRFRTPSLRTVAFTAPYMHNGVFATLEEVMGFYNQGGGDDPNGSTGLTTGGSTGLTTGKDPMLVPLNLTDEEVAALVAFLKSLSGELMLVEEPEFPGFQLMNLGGKP